MQANKGEWSELYVLLKLFSDRNVPAADEKLNPIKGQSYQFVKVIRDGDCGRLVYSLGEDELNILDSDATILKTVDITELPSKTDKLLSRIKEAHAPSFTIADTEELMNELLIDRIKAKSSSKADLIAVIHDRLTDREPELGFSIKSQLGSPSTLLNASSHTNLIYRLANRVDETAINLIDGPSKIRDRLAAIVNEGSELIFEKVESEIFNSNLRLVDSSFPLLAGKMVLDYFSTKLSSCRQLCDRASDLLYADMRGSEIDFKFKTFLRAVALGMTPSTPWDTYLSSYGGYLVVKEDGIIVCYHLYNDDEFKDYLFNNIRFESPSSTRHKYGVVYTVNGVQYMKLNMQLRFTR